MLRVEMWARRLVIRAFATLALSPAFALPRSTPEAQSIPSTSLLAFTNAVDTPADAMNSLMLVRHGHVMGEGW